MKILFVKTKKIVKREIFPKFLRTSRFSIFLWLVLVLLHSSCLIAFFCFVDEARWVVFSMWTVDFFFAKIFKDSFWSHLHISTCEKFCPLYKLNLADLYEPLNQFLTGNHCINKVLLYLLKYLYNLALLQWTPAFSRKSMPFHCSEQMFKLFHLYNHRIFVVVTLKRFNRGAGSWLEIPVKFIFYIGNRTE